MKTRSIAFASLTYVTLGLAPLGACGDTYSNAYLDGSGAPDAIGDATGDGVASDSVASDGVADLLPDDDGSADDASVAPDDGLSAGDGPADSDPDGPVLDAPIQDNGTGDGATDGATGEVAPDAGPDTPAGGGSCGDGTVDPGEFCDDGDTDSEWPPDMASLPPDACISDCSIHMASCGDGALDPTTGEQCDDGDDDDEDGCTTACVSTTMEVGDACHAEGIGQDDNDFTSGTLINCDNVPDQLGGCVKACLRSIDPGFNQPQVYNPGGYCTLLAIKCDGGVLCNLVPTPGDFDTCTACPAGSALEETVTNAAGLTVTTRSCLKTCETQADCRWRAYDARFDQWGQYRCQPSASSPDVNVCKPTQTL